MLRYFNLLGRNAVKASDQFISTAAKNLVLMDFAKLMEKNSKSIIKQNIKDLKFARKKGLKENMILRLSLDKEKIKKISLSILSISKLKDPVNCVLSSWVRPNGLKIRKVTTPIGVIGVIYESRPNVTADVSSLCFKSGNSVILRGGSEAFFTNKLISELFRKALKKNSIGKFTR